MDTTATVWLGLTLGLRPLPRPQVRPFTQKEYYRLYAYFNSVPESGSVDRGGNAAPVLRVASPEAERRLAELRRAVATVDTRLNAALPEIDGEQADWEKTAGAPANWAVADPSSFTSKAGASTAKLEDGSILLGGSSPKNDVHEIVLRSDRDLLTGIRLEAIAHDSLPSHGPGRAPENGNFVLTGIEGEAVSVADPSQSRKLAFAAAQADFSQPGWDVAGAIDADPKTGWAVMGSPTREAIVSTFAFAEPVGFPGGSELRLKLRYESVHPEHVIGRFRLSLTDRRNPPAAGRRRPGRARREARRGAEVAGAPTITGGSRPVSARSMPNSPPHARRRPTSRAPCPSRW